MKKLLLCLLCAIILIGCKTSNNLINYQVFNESFVVPNISKIEDSFSFVLIPDSQSYVDYRLQMDSKPAYPVNQREIYYRQTEWIQKNSINNGGNLSFAIHLGDFVAHSKYKKKEWKYADIGTSKLIDSLPYLFVPGNHDYDTVMSLDFWKTMHLAGSRYYNKYFGPNSKYFKNKNWFGGATKNGMNSWSLINAKGNNILLIGLQMEPSDKVLSWAQNIIDNYPGYPTIITTHEYLVVQTNNQNSVNAEFCNEKYINYSPHNNSEQVWNKFIKKNNQIFLVLCGHSFAGNYGEGLRIDTNLYGNTVYSILTDYQGRNQFIEKMNISHSLNKIEECGDGWLRILDVGLKTKKIHVKTYSTEFDIYETDNDSDYYLDINWECGNRYNK